MISILPQNFNGIVTWYGLTLSEILSTLLEITQVRHTRAQLKVIGIQLWKVTCFDVDKLQKLSYVIYTEYYKPLVILIDDLFT